MILEPSDFARTRDALLQCDLCGLARFMMAAAGAPASQPADAGFHALALDLGWASPEGAALTERGLFMRDPLREYLFWVERDRLLPFDDPVVGLTAVTFAGRTVLEIGSGSGMNLMSLAGHAVELVGLEPIAIYRQMAEIFAEVEGISGFRSLPGAAEDLPFRDASFDTVLCVTAHQYFDIVPALHQIARVLRPGGELIIIGGTMSTYALGEIGRALAAPRQAGKGYVKTMVNTLGYMTLRRRLLVRASKWSTAHPVYPSRRSMRRMIEGSGLVLSRPMHPVGPETCFRATRPA